MKVLIVICVLFAVSQANPQFRALRARASGLGGGGVPPPFPASSPLAAAQPQQAYRPTYQAAPQYQAQPTFQTQPQYQQYQPQAQPQFRYQSAPFGGFQPAQG